MDTRIRKAIGIASAELSRTLRVRDVAARLSLSPSRFQHLFKRETGMSFKAWHLNLRIAEARQMLQTPELRVKQVAFAIGYKFSSTFTRDFKKQFGKTPTEDRMSACSSFD